MVKILFPFQLQVSSGVDDRACQLITASVAMVRGAQQTRLPVAMVIHLQPYE